MPDGNNFSCTVDQVMATQPCSVYTLDYVNQLFNGRDALTGADLIALDIPPTDKLALINNLGWLTSDQTAQVKATMAALITDQTSDYYADYQANGTIYGFGAICSFLADQSGEDRRSFVDQIAQVGVDAVTPMVS